jgi:hypothetical protein
MSDFLGAVARPPSRFMWLALVMVANLFFSQWLKIRVYCLHLSLHIHRRSLCYTMHDVSYYVTHLVVALSTSLLCPFRLFVVFLPPSSCQRSDLNTIRYEGSSIIGNRKVVRKQNWAGDALRPPPHTFGKGTCGNACRFIKELSIQIMRLLALAW